jgi:hypothetical protein
LFTIFLVHCPALASTAHPFAQTYNY